MERTLDILICTIDAGIENVPKVLMPPMENVRYVVSVQYTNPKWLTMIPEALKEREDVFVTFLEGRGLSKNRNNAMTHSHADIMLIADDDCRYEPSFIYNIFNAYEHHPQCDIIHFQALTTDGNLLHKYPEVYVCSVELTIRNSESFRASGIEFNANFGIGSEYLSCGEEDVFIKDAQDAGLSIMYIPKPIVATPAETTGSRMLSDKKVQISKGATFAYVYGTTSALWRTFKEGIWHLIHNRENPLPIVYNMCKGIYLERTKLSL